MDPEDEAPAARPRRRSKAMTALSIACMLGGSLGFLSGGRSAWVDRHDPEREKTPEDLAAIEAAKFRREQREARRRARNKSPD